MRFGVRRAILSIIILSAFVFALWTTPAMHSLTQQRSNDGLSQQEREMEDRRQREANKKRQDEIKQQTDKLFQLATELKDAVDKSNENLLSLEVVRKAEEVEKLAKQVKEKMREGTGKPLKPDQRIEPPSPLPH
jgi:hypothetical protein